jgi:hypothetical protein
VRRGEIENGKLKIEKGRESRLSPRLFQFSIFNFQFSILSPTLQPMGGIR